MIHLASNPISPPQSDRETQRAELYEAQHGRCIGCANDYLDKDLTFDHIDPVAKGGADSFDNLQLAMPQLQQHQRRQTDEFSARKAGKKA